MSSLRGTPVPLHQRTMQRIETPQRGLPGGTFSKNSYFSIWHSQGQAGMLASTPVSPLFLPSQPREQEEDVRQKLRKY